MKRVLTISAALALALAVFALAALAACDNGTTPEDDPYETIDLNIGTLSPHFSCKKVKGLDVPVAISGKVRSGVLGLDTDYRNLVKNNSLKLEIIIDEVGEAPRKAGGKIHFPLAWLSSEDILVGNIKIYFKDYIEDALGLGQG